MNVSKNKFGFVFELGFNIGAISLFIDMIEREDKFKEVVEELKNTSNRLDIYKCILKSDNVDEFLKNSIDSYMFKGYFNGKGFMNEYLNNLKYKENIKLEYVQASFEAKNFGEKDEFEIYNNKKKLEQQLGVKLQDFEINELLAKGEFLRADSIFLFSLYGEYYLIIIDNAISTKNIVDLDDYKAVKKTYINNIISKKTKSNFSDLGIDSESLDIDITSKICDYMLALNNQNKSLYKMIQAGSYTYSFVNFLKTYKFDIYSKLKIVSIYGYADTEIASMNLTRDEFLIEDNDFARPSNNKLSNNKALIEKLDKLINLSSGYKLSDRNNINSSIENKKNNVFLKIKKGFKEKFPSVDMKYLLDIKHSKYLVKENMKIIEDKLENFQNTSGNFNQTQSFRDKHSEHIKKYLMDKDIDIICLTGNPGIGKTTAIVNALKEEESFLFMYISPRTQVNKDIEEKFLLHETKARELYDKEAVYLTADSNDEVLLNGKDVEVVNYNSQNKKFDLDNYNVKFLNINRERELREESEKYLARDSKNIKKINKVSSGVLKRLSKGIKDTIDYNLSNKIIATVAMQSLKSIGDKKTTIHINKIFEELYNDKTKLLNEKEYIKFSAKIQNIVIMIDEITGDESGATFLNDIINVLLKNIKSKLSDEIKNLINIKIIVADASITSANVIKKHLEKSNVDSDKFYFKKVDHNSKSITCEKFKFRDKYNSVIINTNSFPSTHINFKYNIINEIKTVDEKLIKYQGYNTLETIDYNIVERVKSFIEDKKNSKKQVIVYIQNIKRLQEIKAALGKYYQSKNKKINDELLEINSTITESQKKEIFMKKDKVKVVLMTSSAARGISFKNTSTILIDLPDFDLPKNIMEILQLIYRGRGDIYIDTNNHTEIEFYIKNSIYLAKNEELKVKVQEKLFKVMTLILIIKMSIETRIYGSSKLGNEKFMLIPIGGKSISSVSRLDTDKIADAIKALNKEILKGHDELKSVKKEVVSYFSSINYELTNEIIKRENVKEKNFNISNIKNKFMEEWDKSFYQLAKMNILKDFYMVGDLIIFKINNKMKINIELDVRKTIEAKNTDSRESKKSLVNFLKQLCAISKNIKYPYSFRLQINDVYNILQSYQYNNKGINSMNLKEETKQSDRFVAIPLFDLIKPSNINDEDNISMREILELYIKSYYSVCNISPISEFYENESFIIFTSNSFISMRKKIFKSNYMFTSNELNILNLLLLSQ